MVPGGEGGAASRPLCLRGCSSTALGLWRPPGDYGGTAFGLRQRRLRSPAAPRLEGGSTAPTPTPEAACGGTAFGLQGHRVRTGRPGERPCGGLAFGVRWHKDAGSRFATPPFFSLAWLVFTPNEGFHVPICPFGGHARGHYCFITYGYGLVAQKGAVFPMHHHFRHFCLSDQRCEGAFQGCVRRTSDVRHQKEGGGGSLYLHSTLMGSGRCFRKAVRPQRGSTPPPFFNVANFRPSPMASHFAGTQPPPGQRHGQQPASGTADPRSSQTGQVIRGLR